MPSARLRLNKKEVEKDPYLVWNAFLEVLINHELKLSPYQKSIRNVVVYDGEIYNGGHLQYFTNNGTAAVNEVIMTLRVLGGECQAKILEEAMKKWVSQNRDLPDTSQEYSAEAMKGEFNIDDTQYYNCKPNVNEILEKYLKEHQDEYVELVD